MVFKGADFVEGERHANRLMTCTRADDSGLNCVCGVSESVDSSEGHRSGRPKKPMSHLNHLSVITCDPAMSSINPISNGQNTD